MLFFHKGAKDEIIDIILSAYATILCLVYCREINTAPFVAIKTRKKDVKMLDIHSELQNRLI